ncbi:fumarylacetoacetate hydrolase family protein [Microbacterium protaetiae]|uniref:Fumarylacetoacetate hydrolase family protein n=1 Tax=Microbacterium protaetiae TaxID=2509458 RepID=A0A4P6EFR6_9MICO|nr:fumarylacetoacetate hydrolase family protein [Microbacterium protaetiae]QAY60253.1 fumarylacetoacetate hydrolase family protein [Microbacterium protaetiae]
MRLVTYRGSSDSRIGVVLAGDRVLDVRAGALEDIVGDAASLASVREAAEASSPASGLPRIDELDLLPPVRPGKLLCIGYNYRGHVPDGEDPTANDPAYPDVFVKTANVLIGPNDPVQLPQVEADVDYEGEIALVIGRRAKNVPVSTALDHVAGYTLFDDVTARDWQRHGSQFTLGKSFDTFGPLGPWLVTADEIPDPQSLVVEVERAGVVTARQSTATMIFPMAFLVHHLSQVMTLEPGDVISTGTPQKLPDAAATHRSLADGDVVAVRVAGIGELTTRFTTITEDA